MSASAPSVKAKRTGEYRKESGFTFRSSKQDPCPVCGGTDGKCKGLSDGLVICKDAVNHEQHEAEGWAYWPCKKNPYFGLYRRVEDFDPDSLRNQIRRMQSATIELCNGEGDEEPATVHGDEQKRTRWMESIGTGMEPAEGPRLNALADELGIPTDGLELLGARFLADNGHGRPVYVFPERDGRGAEIGYCLRDRGQKRMAPGSGRGIYIPSRQPGKAGDPIFIPEGATCTATFLGMGLRAIGRFSNVGGAAELAEYFRRLPREELNIVVVGENDCKDDGRWPGRDGRRVAQQLANDLGVRVRFVMPPSGAKDVRDWYRDQMRRSKDPKHNRTPTGLGVRLTCWWFDDTNDAEVFRPGNGLPPLTGSPAEARGGDGASEQDAAAAAQSIAAAIDRARAREAAEQAARPVLTPEQLREQEALVARLIRERRREYLADCVRPRYPFFVRDNGDLVMPMCCCDDPEHCPGCRRRCQDREVENARLRFIQAAGQGQQLWENYVAPEAWERVRHWIGRHGGQYHRYRDGMDYWVVANVPFPGSIRGTAEQLASCAETIVRHWDYLGGVRPVSTSHGWKLPQEHDHDSGLQRVQGEGHSSLTPTGIQQIVENTQAQAAALPQEPYPHHVKYEHSVPRNPRGHALAYWCFRTSTDRLRDHLKWQLSLGEPMPLTEILDLDPDPQPMQDPEAANPFMTG